MKTSVTFTPLLLCLFSLFVVTTAHATPIHLNTFFASAPPVAVVDDGSEATIVEEIHVMTQFLSNDPTLGDPEVMIAGNGLRLSFEYHFVEGGQTMMGLVPSSWMMPPALLSMGWCSSPKPRVLARCRLICPG